MVSNVQDNLRTNVVAESRRVPAYVLPIIVFFIVIVDVAIAGASLIAAFVFREDLPVLSQTAWAWSKEFVPYAGILYFAMIIRVIILAYVGVFRFQGAFSYTNEALKVFKAVAIGTLLIVSWAFLFRGGYAFREFSYARSVFLFDFGFVLISLLVFHLAIRYIQSQFRRKHLNLLPTLVVGTNAEAQQTIAALTNDPSIGYRVVAAVDSGSGGDVPTEVSTVPVVGSFAELPQLIQRLCIQEVIITDNQIDSSRLFETMMQVGRSRKVEFIFAPSLFDLLPQKTSVEQVGVLPMIRLFREPLSDTQRFIKRLSDIFISTAAIVITSPIMLLAALVVKCGSRGPILFRQERVGMDGRVFLCYKFRTMFADSDDELHRKASKRNIGLTCQADLGDDEDHADKEAENTTFGKVKNDPRITPYGRFLRRLSLDELPQLFNVLKGDMSIVGPRPPIPYEVEEYEHCHRKRLDMKPGITGLWQVSGRNRIRFEEMVRLDVYYIENWSIWLDLKIILLTLPAVFKGEGEK